MNVGDPAAGTGNKTNKFPAPTPAAAAAARHSIPLLSVEKFQNAKSSAGNLLGSKLPTGQHHSPRISLDKLPNIKLSVGHIRSPKLSSAQNRNSVSALLPSDKIQNPKIPAAQKKNSILSSEKIPHPKLTAPNLQNSKISAAQPQTLNPNTNTQDQLKQHQRPHQHFHEDLHSIRTYEQDPSDSDNDDDEIERVVNTDPEFPIGGYILLNCLLVFWGTTGLVTTHFLASSHNVAEELLYINPRDLDLPPHILYISCGLTVAAGLFALLCVGCESSAFFSYLPHLNGLIIGLDVTAFLSAFFSWNWNTEINKFTYQRLMEAEIFGTNRHDLLDPMFIQVFGSKYKGHWDKIQKRLQCCGLEGPHNWIQSICNCIPVSCCAQSTFESCVTSIQQWTNPLSTVHKDLSKVQHLLWSKNCFTAISQEMTSLRRDWLTYPCILLFFQLILMVNINYLVVAVGHRYDVLAGFSHLQHWKHRVTGKVIRIICFPCSRSSCVTRHPNLNAIVNHPSRSPSITSSSDRSMMGRNHHGTHHGPMGVTDDDADDDNDDKFMRRSRRSHHSHHSRKHIQSLPNETSTNTKAKLDSEKT